MSEFLKTLLSHLEMQPALDFEKLRIVPLGLNVRSNLDYLVLEDDPDGELITLEETSDHGSVPTIHVRNRASRPVFIPEGSTLLGAKQNRVVNMSVMLAPTSVTAIPVSCVESGRWARQSPQFAHGDFADKGLRQKMSAQATASLRSAKRVHVDQGEVWEHVEGVLHQTGSPSPTRAYHAAYAKVRDQTAAYEQHLRLPETACGVAVEIDGRLEAVDLFDRPETCQKVWSKLIKGYVLEALSRGPGAAPELGLSELLDKVGAAQQEPYTPVGLGQTVRLSCDGADASALLWNDDLVHLSMFTRPPRPAARPAPVPDPATVPVPVSPTPISAEPEPEPKPVQGRWQMFWDWVTGKSKSTPRSK